MLSFGPTYTLIANQVYAMPAVKATVCTASATPGVEWSNDISFATKLAVTFDTNGQAILVGGFIRSTLGGINVTLKRD